VVVILARVLRGLDRIGKQRRQAAAHAVLQHSDYLSDQTRGRKCPRGHKPGVKFWPNGGQGSTRSKRPR